MPLPRFKHGFENDVFISYCHVDDVPDPSERRWVTKFQIDLTTRLMQNSAHSVAVWRDRKLDSADRFDEEIQHQLRKSAVLVAILTPSYLSSDFCRREWREFMRVSPDLGNTTRMIKVAKMHVPLEKYPKELRATNQHNFFVQEDNGSYREYHLHPDPRVERQYGAHVDDVAQELARILHRMEGAAAGLSFRGIVYVGETSSDLNAERDNICRALTQLRYEVVPKAPLAGLPAPQIRDSVRRDLASAALAIVPVGAYYDSIVKIQLEAAESDRRNGDFPRLIWMPKDLQPAETRQQQFINEIRETWAQRKFEVLEIFPYQLQDVLAVRLNAPQRIVHAADRHADSEPENPSVYVLSEHQDVDAAQAVRRWLFEQGFEVPGPPENWTDPAALRDDLRRRFLEDDAFLVYYGQTTESWVREKVREISKANGMDRKSPILAHAVFVADPPTPNKENLLLRNALRGFAPSPFDQSLGPFVNSIRSGWRDRFSAGSGGAP